MIVLGRTSPTQYTIPVNIVMEKLEKIKSRLNSTLAELESINKHIVINIPEKITSDQWIIALLGMENYMLYNFNKKNRDKGMAEVAIKMINKLYSDKKIIIWAHNNHIALDVNTFASSNPGFPRYWHSNNTYEGFAYLGADLYGEYGNEIYSIAMTSYQGNFTPSPHFWNSEKFKNTIPVIKPSDVSLENFFYKIDKQNPVFIPLPPNSQGLPSSYPWFSAKLFDINIETKMDYTSSFKGINFFPETFGLKSIDEKINCNTTQQ